jgi:hypothetical protein
LTRLRPYAIRQHASAILCYNFPSDTNYFVQRIGVPTLYTTAA